MLSGFGGFLLPMVSHDHNGNKKLWIGLMMLASGALVGASAATASTDAAQAMSSTLNAGTGALDLAALVQAATPLLSAGGVSLFKYFLPKIPRAILPFLTPFLGAAVEVLAHLAGLSEASPLRGALLGACGVFVHEAFSQSKKILSSEQQ
ncbi:MAG: hypothetical protein PHI67_10460 [Candidatus Methanomethylophilaceae archaeon]|nr:hypothetical protein [Candidatus Methanomethylophilaceae archaeon]